MAALTTERNTPKSDARTMPGTGSQPQKASTKIYKGALVVLNAGYAAPGTTATGLIACGVASATSDNSSGANGDINAAYVAGVFRFDNSAAADAIAQADVGADCYIVDDHTVAKTSATSTRSRAGKIMAVDTTGVWVQIAIGV